MLREVPAVKFAHMSHIWRKPGLSHAQRYAQLWRELELCDAVGFDYGFCVEHHVDPNESVSVSPPRYIAGAAARTQRLRLGAMGWLVPLYDPLRVVEEVVSLDNLTEGRLDVGLVSGALPQHFIPYKGDFEHRRERAIEGYELMKAAFANPDSFSYKGPYHEYENVALQMHPVQTPTPPVWFETRHPPTLEYLADEGIHTGYVHYVHRAEMAELYREYINRWRAVGHPYQPDINYWILVYVDETDDKAWEVAGPSWVHTYTKIALLDKLIESRVRRGEHHGAEMLRHFTDPPYMREHNIGLIGSPAIVAEKLRAFASEGLFNTLLGEFNFGYLEEEQVMRSIRLFGEEVIPRLRYFEPY
jgi:alkanesulfonate monooxygenase SsuD/methylene tetrahydromethanopterin reductase-like flavin-dependent oxidoreductase (luciferase family)